MKKFQPFSGMVTMINDFLIDESGEGLGCYKLMSVENGLWEFSEFCCAARYLLCRPCNGVTW